MVSLYEITIPVFLKNLQTLSKLLDKGVAHTQNPELNKTGLTAEKITQARLIEDMGDFVYQIQRVSDTAKGLAVRIGKAEPVPMEDNEKTIDDLQARIAKTVKVLEGVKESDMVDAEGVEVIIKTRNGEQKFTGKSYVLDFAIPNFFFHVVAAYALLRKEGVDVGKGNFLGRF